MQLGRRVRAARGAADDDPAARLGDGERALPGCLADVLDDHVDAALGRLLDLRGDVAVGVIDDRVRAELARPLELDVARRGRDDLRSKRLRDRERCERHASADAPGEHPLSRLQAGLRDQHPVRRLEGERERRGLLERHRVRNRVHVLLRQRDQLGVRAVPVLAQHVRAVFEPGVDDDPLAGVHPFAGAVGTEDEGLRDRRLPLADPEVDVVQRRRAQPHQNLAVSR